jgi:hypothetical protein
MDRFGGGRPPRTPDTEKNTYSLFTSAGEQRTRTPVKPPDQ